MCIVAPIFLFPRASKKGLRAFLFFLPATAAVVVAAAQGALEQQKNKNKDKYSPPLSEPECLHNFTVQNSNIGPKALMKELLMP